MKKNSETPKYKHDCSVCDFLGEYGHYDLYFCNTEPTVVARFSDKGADYMSGLCFTTTDGNTPLDEAKRRAIEKGLYKEAQGNKNEKL